MLSLFLPLLFLLQPAFAKEEPFWKLYDFHESLEPKEAGVFPCSGDVDRIKELAATKLMEMDINPKKKIRKPKLDTVLVKLTSGRDAVFLRMLGGIPPEQTGRRKYLTIEAQAICAPATGKFELLSIAVSD